MKEASVLPDNGTQNNLVVVHGVDGTLIKGVLKWDTITGQIVPLSPLPDALPIRCEMSGESLLVPLSEAKAIFFVKGHEGILDHDDVKFFSDVAATDLWIRIRFADGEVLEGRTQNTTRLLVDHGVWLRPFDGTGNNVLIYVPKAAVMEFHVMGVAVPRSHAVAGEAAVSCNSA